MPEKMDVKNSILETIGNTPLVRLQRVGRSVPADLLAKVEFFNPGGSVKDRIGVAMIRAEEEAGRLQPGGMVVECTSGNTGVGLALAAALAAPHLVARDHPGLCVGSAPGMGLMCTGWQLLIAIPIFLVSLWFILRGAAVSSALAGALAGLGAGLLSDAAIHLHCPAVDPSHTVTWHLGAVALLTAVGALIGRVLPKW